MFALRVKKGMFWILYTYIYIHDLIVRSVIIRVY